MNTTDFYKVYSSLEDKVNEYFYEKYGTMVEYFTIIEGGCIDCELTIEVLMYDGQDRSVDFCEMLGGIWEWI